MKEYQCTGFGGITSLSANRSFTCPPVLSGSFFGLSLRPNVSPDDSIMPKTTSIVKTSQSMVDTAPSTQPPRPIGCSKWRVEGDGTTWTTYTSPLWTNSASLQKQLDMHYAGQYSVQVCSAYLPSSLDLWELTRLYLAEARCLQNLGLGRFEVDMI